MNKREIERLHRIGGIINAIKGREDIDFGKLCLEIQFKYGVSRRTAMEYLEVAKSQNG